MSIIRRLLIPVLSFLTKNKGIRISLHGQDIRIPARYLGFFPKDYEASNFRFYRQTVQPGDTCLDIGAHLGIVSVYLAKKCNARVFAFEPTPSIFHTFQIIVNMNNAGAAVSGNQVAVSGTSGRGIFYLNTSAGQQANNERIAEANSLLNTDFGETITRTAIETDLITVDDFAKRRQLTVNFIKLDAEGAEKDILAGAGKTMRDHRPSGIVSVHNFAFADRDLELVDIWEMMNDYSMQLFYEGNPLTKEGFLALRTMDIFDFQFSPVS